MTYITSARVLVFLWRIGLVDTYGLVQFFLNAGAQYTSIVAAEIFSQSKFGSIKPINAGLLPLTGLRTCVQYIQSAPDTHTAYLRKLQVYGYLGGSVATATRNNPGASGLYGAIIQDFISAMKKNITNTNVPFIKPLYLTNNECHAVIIVLGSTIVIIFI